jgi:hypothetical protein
MLMCYVAESGFFIFRPNICDLRDLNFKFVGGGVLLDTGTVTTHLENHPICRQSIDGASGRKQTSHLLTRLV